MRILTLMISSTKRNASELLEPVDHQPVSDPFSSIIIQVPRRTDPGASLGAVWDCEMNSTSSSDLSGRESRTAPSGGAGPRLWRGVGTPVILQTQNYQETIQIGRAIGSLLRAGDLVALVGELGTGKTHLIKGLATGAGVRRASYVSSPSFTLIHEYPGRIPFRHIDLFRLGAEKEAEGLGLEEYFGGPGIAAIEWADRIPSLLPSEMLWIRLRCTGDRSRSIEILAKGKRYEELVRKLPDVLGARDSSRRKRSSRARVRKVSRS